MQKPRLLVILGPTASGKSSLAVELAQKYNGEVVSADSRQVYKGLDLGTGKITPAEMQGVPHHLLDVADPATTFTVSDFKLLAEKAIDDIIARGKLPILCGGTGFYIQAVVDNVTLPEVPPNDALRNELETKTAEELFERLQKMDPDRAADLDHHNKRRLIRAIEIAEALGKVPKLESESQKNSGKCDTFQIGIETPDDELKKNIHARILSRIDTGMIKEVAALHKNGLSWERLDDLGLEYRYISKHLQGELSKDELIAMLDLKIWQYVKRQRTWFKRDERIQWLSLLQKNIIFEVLDRFLS